MYSYLEQIQHLSNHELDQQIKLLSEHFSTMENFSPTSDFLLANKLIDAEKIIVKQNKVEHFYVPVFEYGNYQYGIFESTSYLRTAMMYYLAKKTGVIQES